MLLNYEIFGYDSKTHQLEVEFLIPEKKIRVVKEIAGLNQRDDSLSQYPLNSMQIVKISRVMYIPIRDDIEYFITLYEPSKFILPLRSYTTGYSLDLYCDCVSFQHSCDEFPHQFTGETFSGCASEARKRGWIIHKPTHTATCPKCSGKKFKTKTLNSKYEYITISPSPTS
jgi:hypothetical protein